MKKLCVFIFIVVLACLFLDKIGSSHWAMNINGNDVDGPLEWLFGIVFAGGGMLIAVLAVICVAALVGVLMAGVGLFVVAILAACLLLPLLFFAPFLLPLLIPVAIIWMIVSRNRRRAQ